MCMAWFQNKYPKTIYPNDIYPKTMQPNTTLTQK